MASGVPAQPQAGASVASTQVTDPRAGPVREPRSADAKPEPQAADTQPSERAADLKLVPPPDGGRAALEPAPRAIACEALSAWGGETAIGCYSDSVRTRF